MMLSKSTRLILSKAIAEQDKKSLTFIVGLCLTIPAGFGFASLTPPWLIKLATGMGTGLTVAVVATSLLVLGILVTQSYGYGKLHSAYIWLHDWATPKLAKTTFTLLGISIGTFVFWLFAHDQSALQTCLLALLLTISILWNWAGLTICKSELTKRFARI